MLEIQNTRLSVHNSRWADGCLEKIRKLKSSSCEETLLRDEASLLLQGMDARITKFINLQPIEISFDATGNRLLMTYQFSEPKSTVVRQIAKVWDASKERLDVLAESRHDVRTNHISTRWCACSANLGQKRFEQNSYAEPAESNFRSSV